MQTPVQEIQAPTEPQVPVQIQGGSAPVVETVVAETIEGGKKRCANGMHRGKDGKCHRVSKRKSGSRKHKKSKSPRKGRKSAGRKMRGGEECITADRIEGGSTEAPAPVETVAVIEGGENLEAGKAQGAKAHSKGRKAAVAKAKKMCVKASGKTSSIRASIKKAKKSKSAMKRRCNSKKNKARRSARKASRRM